MRVVVEGKIKDIPTKRSSKRIEEQSVDVHVPQVAAIILEVIKDKDTLQERISERVQEEIVDVSQEFAG